MAHRRVHDNSVKKRRSSGRPRAARLGTNAMSDMTVVARGGQWVVLDDEDDAELGSYGSQAEALKAAGDFARVDQEPRHVLIQDGIGDWEEELVEPPALH
jgi:hypothetical protein